MLVVRVELRSAITGKVTEIARMPLWNLGTGTAKRGNYKGRTVPGKTDGPMIVPAMFLEGRKPMRSAEVDNYPRQSLHVWNLIARMLTAMGYK